MHWHLCDHIYITQFREEFILLDTKADSYTICLKHFSNLLPKLLSRRKENREGNVFERKKASSENFFFAEEGSAVKNFLSDEDHFCANEFSSPNTQFSMQELETIQKLLENQIIEKKETPYPFYIDRKINSEGVSNIAWSLPLENKRVVFSFWVLRAFITLLKVHLYMKIKGFYPTLQLIKNSKKEKFNYTIPGDDELRDLANIVNKACLIYPTRTKCLEWSITFILLALTRKWKCNLEIGVQNYPFFAHAWVECGEKVVMDSQSLREGLSIILNEPFRKLKE